MSGLDNGRADVDGEPTVAVTGAAGFIGSRVVVDLQNKHPEWGLIGLDNQYRGQVDSVGALDVQHVDIRDRGRLEATLDGADVVLHLAAISGVDDCDENPDLAYEVNVTGTNNVAWFCRKTGTALTFPFSMAALGDPETFPITADLPRDPMNWYGRTKCLGERAVETFAEGSFPAHLLLKANLYGNHTVDGTVVSKPTVVNFFINRALSGDSLTVYEPGTQSRNFVHLRDVSRAYLASAERLLAGEESGARTYEIASREDPSVLEVARAVQRLASEEADIQTEIEVIENPRGNETLVETFDVETSKARRELGWEPEESVESTVREMIRAQTD